MENKISDKDNECINVHLINIFGHKNFESITEKTYKYTSLLLKILWTLLHMNILKALIKHFQKCLKIILISEFMIWNASFISFIDGVGLFGLFVFF